MCKIAECTRVAQPARIHRSGAHRSHRLLPGWGICADLSQDGLISCLGPFLWQIARPARRSLPHRGQLRRRDKTTTPEFEKIKREVERLGIPHNSNSSGVGHNFMNRAPNAVLGFLSSIAPIHGGYNPEVASDATQRVLTFLKAHV